MRLGRRLLESLIALPVLMILAMAVGCLVPLGPSGSASPGLASPGPVPQARTGAREAAGTAGRHGVLVLSSAIHTDLALPAEPETLRRFGFLAEAGLPLEHPDVAYVAVGWGGRSFYLETPRWSDLKPGPLLRSFTGDASVLHVELTGGIDRTRPGIREIDLDDRDFEALLAFVEASFSRDAKKRPAEIGGAGYGEFDRFFEAEGRFSALAGCNVWTARALREAGITTGLWTPLPATLFWSLDLHGR